MEDPFALLGAPRRYDLDLDAVEKSHRELSRALHPDKFASAGASERREALEKAADVNEAWRILRDPLRRAEALFGLAGIPIAEDSHSSTISVPPQFLMQMMASREELADARAAKDLAKVQKLGEQIREKWDVAELKLAAGLEKNPSSVVGVLGELRFYKRFLDEVEAIEDEADG
ncbi:MAG: Fe-S protein assembly co-chaperone HscB [Labilithrix sp.]|nr:Fe-S protein assembly co-chaperone HscB [Labilithrix sp.]MCW5812123.1 Fe-S protein assembly co-chaperone HscB [Labilithrix sp.]